MEELEDGRVVENARGSAAGVDSAVIPRGAELIWVARACALFRLLGVQDKLIGTLLCPGCGAAFVSGVPDGWVRRMPRTRVPVDGSEADLRQNVQPSTATTDVHFLGQALAGADFCTCS